jgi:hypothetical protein
MESAAVLRSGVLPLSKCTRNVGSRVPESKKRSVWVFIVRQVRYEVVLLHSPATSKVVLSVDGQQILSTHTNSHSTADGSEANEGGQQGTASWNHAFELGGSAVAVYAHPPAAQQPAPGQPAPAETDGAAVAEAAGAASAPPSPPPAAAAAAAAAPSASSYELRVDGQSFDALLERMHSSSGGAAADLPRADYLPPAQEPPAAAAASARLATAASAAAAAPFTSLESDCEMLAGFHARLALLGIDLPLPLWVSEALPVDRQQQAGKQDEREDGVGGQAAGVAGGWEGTADQAAATWEIVYAEDGQQYFFCEQSGESLWELPQGAELVHPSRDDGTCSFNAADQSPASTSVALEQCQ